MKSLLKKILIILSTSILFCLIFSLVGCSQTDNSDNGENNGDSGNETPIETIAEITSFDGATIDGEKISMFVEHEIDSVSLSGKVQVSKDCTWKLYSDKLGRNEIPTKVAVSNSGELLDGDNQFYILVSSNTEDKINFYELTIHRSYEVVITYWFNDEIYKTEKVFTGHEYNLFSPTLKGYDFIYWTNKSNQKIVKEIIWSATSYYAKANAKKYTLSFNINDCDSREIEYNSQFTLIVPQKNGYSFEGWAINDNLITDNKGNSLLKWNYIENQIACPVWKPIKINITIKTNNSSTEEDFGLKEIFFDEEVTLNAVPDLGYDFLGWYQSDNNELLSNSLTYNFIATSNIELETKWNVKDELLPFNFSSTYRNCMIISVKDKTLETYIIPEYVNNIQPNCFENCKNLKFITIPKSVTLINRYAFKGCTNLTDVFFEQTSWIAAEDSWNSNGISTTDSKRNAEYLTTTYCDRWWRPI